MNYWIFKFNSKLWGDENWDKIPEGTVEFWRCGSNEKNLDDRLGDIVFAYRTDKNRGIYYILKIVADMREPMPVSEMDTGAGIKLETIKKLEPYYPEERLYEKHEEWIEKSKKIGNSPRYRFRDEFHPLSEKIYKEIMNG